MTLITEAQHTTLLANGIAARDAARAGIDFDPKPVVKLFTPHWYGRWLLTEIDPEHPLRARLRPLRHGRRPPVLGLDNSHGKIKFTVAADPGFVADKPLSIYAEVA